MMELEDEEAPTLIDLANGPDLALTDDVPTGQIQDLSLSKVPLTIVTGNIVMKNTIAIGLQITHRLQATLALEKVLSLITF